MARNDFAIERSRKISIAISGYDAASASKTQQVKNAKRLERLRAEQERKQREQTEAERGCRYDQACSEMDDFDSLNEALANAAANPSLIEAFGATGHEARALLQ
jgi:hypothetical protein